MGTEEMTHQENTLSHKSNNMSSDPQNPGKSQTQWCICMYSQEDWKHLKLTGQLAWWAARLTLS